MKSLEECMACNTGNIVFGYKTLFKGLYVVRPLLENRVTDISKAPNKCLLDPLLEIPDM